MADMFGRETVLGGVMSAEATTVKFSGGKDANYLNTGLIMQMMQIQYAQNVTRLYALEDAKVYFVAGRTEGQFTIQHVVGPQGLMTSFLRQYGNVCDIGDQVLELQAQAGCGTSVASNAFGKATVRLKAPLITSFGLQMQAGNMIMASTLNGMFVSLEVEEGQTSQQKNAGTPLSFGSGTLV